MTSPRPARVFTPEPRFGLSMLALLSLPPLVFALTTWHPGPEPAPWLAGVRRFSAPVVALEAIAVIAAMARGFEPLAVLRSWSRPVRIALAALAAIALFTAFLIAPDQPTALARTCTTFVHLLFGLAMADLIGRGSVPRRSIWPSIVVGQCLYILTLPAYLAAIPDWSAFNWRYFGFGVVNIRQVGFYAAVGGSGALALMATARRPGHAAAWLAAAAATFALSSWSGTRGSIVAVLGGVAAAAIIVPPLRSRRLIVGTLLALATGIAAGSPFAPPDPHFGVVRISSTLAEQGADALSSGRISMWTATLEAIGDSPLFGYGESQFRAVLGFPFEAYLHPHNALLQILLQWGVIGTTLLLFLAWRIWPTILSGVRSQAVEAAPAVAVAATLGIFSGYEGTLFHPFPVMMVVLAVAHVWTLGRAASAPATATGRPPRSAPRR